MLECYFDDSGTHDGAPALVWGGIVGTSEQITDLSETWRALLRRPLPGKPPLRQFHLAQCAISEGEFAHYTPAERDAVRFEFRQIMANAGVEGVGFAVSRRDWDDLIQGAAREYFGSAEEVSMGGCIRFGLEHAAARDEDRVSLTFDIGRRTPELQAQTERVLANYEGPAQLDRIDFLPVIEMPPLQAADTIATESYWYACDWLQDARAAFRPHFRNLMENINAARFMMDRDEIQQNLGRFNLGLMPKLP